MYHDDEMNNRFVIEQSSKAYNDLLLGQESYFKIVAEHPDRLYTPNLFIRIALGLLTLVAVLFSGILLAFLVQPSGMSSAMILLILSAIACFASLELLIRNKRYYNAGVDNVLIFYIVLFSVAALFANDVNADYRFVSAVTLLLCAFLAIRYADSFAASLTYISFLLFGFMVYIKFGDFAKLTVPFFMAATSGIMYMQMTKLIKRENILIYRGSFEVVRWLTMLSFYGSLNYFVVRELGNKMFAMNYSASHPFAFGWFFWITTITIPIVYLVLGIKKKDLVFIRTGFVLIATSIFTVRYYHSALPAEIAMLLAGLILIILSSLLIKILKSPKHGFTFKNRNTSARALNIEGMIVGQTLGHQHPGAGHSDQHHDLFGEGSGGGAGAGGEY